jgi:hypothetical protein
LKNTVHGVAGVLKEAFVVLCLLPNGFLVKPEKIPLLMISE